MNLLFVVHRAYPYPGGSEMFVHWMAQECTRRGHHAVILADTHKGDVGEVHVTSDHTIVHALFWDLIIVHGADCSTQNYVHRVMPNAPVLYQIIQPSNTEIAREGMRKARFLGFSTAQDMYHIMNQRLSDKAAYIPHGIPRDRLGRPGFKKRFGITSRMFMSAGGFWAHKGMKPLVDMWQKRSPQDSVLCLFGYAHEELAPQGRIIRPTDENVEPPKAGEVILFSGFSDQTILDALSEAHLYIMNSSVEGFGLVLLEAMQNLTPWLSRPVGGAPDMKDYGFMSDFLDTHSFTQYASYKDDTDWVVKRWGYVQEKHLIDHTVDGIEKVLGRL